MPIYRPLTEKTGVQLRVKQALSGSWLPFAVDLDELANQAAARLGKHGVVVNQKLLCPLWPSASWTLKLAGFQNLSDRTMCLPRLTQVIQYFQARGTEGLPDD